MPLFVWLAALALHSVGPAPKKAAAPPPPTPPPPIPVIAPPAAPTGVLRLTATWGDQRLRTQNSVISIVPVAAETFATSNSQSMHLWSWRTGEEMASVPLEIDSPLPVASADGRLLAVEHPKDVTAIYDIAARRFTKAVPVGRPLYLANGGGLLVGYQQDKKTYQLWDVAGTRKLWERHGTPPDAGSGYVGAWMSASDGMRGVLASADGRFAAAISFLRPRCELVVMDLRTLDVRHKAAVASCPRTLRFAAGAAGDRRLVAAGEHLAVWDFEQSKTPREMALETAARAELAAASPREDRVVQWTRTDIAVWSAAGGKRLWTKPRPAGDPYQGGAATFSPDGRYVVASDWGKSAHLIAWETDSGRQVYARDDVFARVGNGLAFDASGRMAVAGRSNHIVLLDASGAANPKSPRFSGDVSALAESRDGRLIAAGTGDGSVVVIDATTGAVANVLRRPDPEYRRVTQVAFSPDGSELIAAADGRTRYAEVWTLATGRPARTIASAGSSTFSRVRILPNGRVLAEESRAAEVGELQDGAHIMTSYETATGKTLSRWRARRPDDDRMLLDLASADGSEAAMFGPGATVRITDVATGDARRSFELPPRSNVIALSPDGRRLAALAADGTGSVLDARSGKRLRSLRGMAAYLPLIAFSPDGQWLAVANWKGPLALWDLRANAGDAPAGVWGMQTLTDRPASLLFSSDGKRLLVGTGRGLVRVLTLDTRG